MNASDPSRIVRRAMMLLAGVALTAFLVALWPFPPRPPAAPPAVHTVMAVGILPLILGAMIYFTPVLTHSRAPSWPVLLAPLLALAAGVAATVCLLWRRDLVVLPAVAAFLVVGALLGWMGHRARTMLGRPHPGLHWYVAALISLLLGLAAIIGAAILPEQATAFRRFHLHINTLGFVGLTAFGTLRVLVPTAAGYADPEARDRLQRDLPVVTAGAGLIATGAASWPWLAWPGLALWIFPLARFAFTLASRWRKAVWGWHRASASLGFAVFGLLAVLVTGGLHAADASPPGVAVPLFFFVFLFPLVTGAVSHLLPVWIWPARNAPAYANTARRLVYASGVQALLFLVAGVLALHDAADAIYFALAGLALFVLQGVWAFWPVAE